MSALASYAVVSLSSVVRAVEERAPADEDVVAGWMGFAVFVFLIAAVVVLGWSLTKHLRKTERAHAEGVFGDDPVEDEARPARDE